MTPVFFYGLFMDASLLRDKGFSPSEPVITCVDDFRLRIGARATLLPVPGERAYGTVMALSESEIEALYGDDSVADYVPEHVTARTLAGAEIPTVSYILPEDKLSGQNAEYLGKLISIAEIIGLPDEYFASLKAMA